MSTMSAAAASSAAAAASCKRPREEFTAVQASHVCCPTCGDHFRGCVAALVPRRLQCGHLLCLACVDTLVLSGVTDCQVCSKPFAPHVADRALADYAEGAWEAVREAEPPVSLLTAPFAWAAAQVSSLYSQLVPAPPVVTPDQATAPTPDPAVVSALQRDCVKRALSMRGSAARCGKHAADVQRACDAECAKLKETMERLCADLQERAKRLASKARIVTAANLKAVDVHVDELTVSATQLEAMGAVYRDALARGESSALRNAVEAARATARIRESRFPLVTTKVVASVECMQRKISMFGTAMEVRGARVARLPPRHAPMCVCVCVRLSLQSLCDCDASAGLAPKERCTVHPPLKARKGQE